MYLEEFAAKALYRRDASEVLSDTKDLYGCIIKMLCNPLCKVSYYEKKYQGTVYLSLLLKWYAGTKYTDIICMCHHTYVMFTGAVIKIKVHM